MPPKVRRQTRVRSGATVQLGITVDAVSIGNVEKALNPRLHVRLQHEMMENIRIELHKAFVKAVVKEFPSSQTLRRAIFTRYTRRSGILTVWYNTKGLSDPTTGRPLSEYIQSIQTFNGTRSRTKRPNPPLVTVDDRGHVIISGVVLNRILPWVKRTLDSTGDPMAIAIEIARDIQADGVERKDVIGHVYDPQRIRQGFLAALRPDLSRRVGSIINNFRRQAARV